MNEVKEITWTSVWLLIGLFFGALFMTTDQLNTITKLRIENEQLIQQTIKRKVNSYTTISIYKGCEDGQCITYGGKCKDSSNSIAVISNKTDLREECNNESNIKYQYLGNGYWYLLEKDKK